ncbi:toprim domain-containing protein [Mesorhizobium sp. IMUNJ 23232]|uniref:DUF7146 domain-containing protein n=1 Tax=Mesorhizobium sp. IMUNJ 23232 TaxID=3376064 RepID=UPI0037A555FD
MKAYVLAQILQGDAIANNRVLAPGPGHSRSDRSMSVLLDPLARDGFVVSSFAGDHWRQCRHYIHDRLGLPAPALDLGGVARFRAVLLSPPALEPKTIALAARIWEQAGPIEGTAVARYLRQRGIRLLDDLLGGRVLRFHPQCPFRIKDSDVIRLPAMLAVMRDVHTDEFRGIHRTALAAGGEGKAIMSDHANPKRMLGVARNASAKLSHHEDVIEGLHIAEGIETSLACMSMGFRPVWATLSSGGMAHLPVLSGVEALTIFADNDAAGLKAAQACSERWVAAGKEVTTIVPKDRQSDFADCCAS